jgi:hypothetical protein
MDYFILDAITGELRTARPLDKEAVDNPQGILTLNIKVRFIAIPLCHKQAALRTFLNLKISVSCFFIYIQILLGFAN